MAKGRHADLRLAAVAPQVIEAQASGLDWLTDEERIRLGKMRSENRQRQFLAGHWMVRCLAADVVGGEPQEWVLSSGPEGIPSLASPMHGAGQGVAASIAHSADWVAVAIASFPLGIDLEFESKPRDLLALADTAFSPMECAELRRLPTSERSVAFYQYWTLKEAVGKRAGHGMRPELARRQLPLECAASEAEVFSWQFDRVSVALAGEIGMSLRVTGVPDDARQRCWQIGSATV